MRARTFCHSAFASSGRPSARATTPADGAPKGLPVGVQVIAGRYREDLALDAAEVIEAQHGLETPIDPVW